MIAASERWIYKLWTDRRYGLSKFYINHRLAKAQNSPSGLDMIGNLRWCPQEVCFCTTTKFLAKQYVSYANVKFVLGKAHESILAER
jgi:hypothetical protein